MVGSVVRLAAIPAVLAIAIAARATRSDGELATHRPGPAPTLEQRLASTAREDTAVFAGGCFWGIEAVFEHVKGVSSATSGYAGGDLPSPSYEQVSTGRTGYAESVRVVFDPSQVSYGTLLQIFFSVAHDPTQLNRQGPDVGTQYRSIAFYANPEQKRIVDAYIRQLTEAKFFARPIVTQVLPLRSFYPAEAYHQHYAMRHQDQPYIAMFDLPKVALLRREFPALYHEVAGSN